MTKDEINDTVECKREADPDDDVVFQYHKVKHATRKAVLVMVDGEKIWLPYSHLVEWYPESNEACISSWLAGQNGLL